MALTEDEAADLFRHEPDRFIDVGGAEVAVRTVGTGPDVLFVHGWPVSGATFRKLLPHLVDHVTCHVIDLPSAGSSRFDENSTLTIQGYIESVKRVIGALDVDDIAVVGHDSGGLITRHAVAGDERVRALGLIDTEPPKVGWRFRTFLAPRKLPGFGAALGWLAGKPTLRRNGFVLGDAFVDRSLLDGEFEEFFLRPLSSSPRHLKASMAVLRSFDLQYVRDLPQVHQRISVPVQMVWGEEDKFFPVADAREMVGTFADARLTVVPGAGLFSHEEKPAEVAAALLPVLAGPG